MVGAGTFMSQDFAFLFGVHNHQPVGNFGWVFENAVRDCYAPFLRMMNSHPAIKFSAHYSGPLLEYLREHHSEVWDLLGKLTDRGQVELLGGGFYEPILTIIPEEDRQGQIELMSAYLASHFGRRPRGLWLTERVWEPFLAKTLASAGIEYTLLDEEHFHYSGVTSLHDVYLTEDEGFPLRLLPIDQKLRYFIPFHALADIEKYFDEIRGSGGLAVLGDDGEKFGLWPGTKSWVYDKGWLENFLCFLEDRNIRTMTYAEAIDGRPPAGRVYPPPASYEEMMEWVLEPAEAAQYRRLKSIVPAEARRFLRGGYFKDFLKKYPESRHLRQRMLDISRSVRRLKDTEALRELYQGQGNDPFWHGVFGGLYLPHLREAAYEHLLKAEARVPVSAGWKASDLDLDGRDEYRWKDDRFGLSLKPNGGGGIVEIDYYPLARNLSDVLSRRLETYHLPEASISGGGAEGKSIHEISKPLPPGAERLLRPDRGPRKSAIDRFFEIETTLERFREGDEPDRGDFAEGDFTSAVTDDRLILTRSGRVAVGPLSIPVAIRKEIITGVSGFQVRTMIHNDGDRDLRFVYAAEWNLYQILEEMEVIGTSVRLCRGRLVLASLDPDMELWMVPLQTLSQSEKDFDIIHQGICLAWARRVCLEPGGTVETVIELSESHET